MIAVCNRHLRYIPLVSCDTPWPQRMLEPFPEPLNVLDLGEVKWGNVEKYVRDLTGFIQNGDQDAPKGAYNEGTSTS